MAEYYEGATVDSEHIYSPFISREEAARSANIWITALFLVFTTGIAMFLYSYKDMPPHGQMVSMTTLTLVTVWCLWRLWRAERVLYRTRHTTS